ncbi:MAG: exo-alpha-sialidase [Verrucomicrobiae bacterium]|nr:exo-alpha-sialidase [Verrucomicrobiae bacterium]
MRVSLFLAFVFFAFQSGLASEPLLHPAASRLPCDHQGPFVTAGDGSILCLEAKETLRSRDEGRTWTASPLFKAPEKYTVSNERALLRTREGVIVGAFMNLVERRSPKGWHWGEKGVDWREFVLPTFTIRSTDDGKTWEDPVKLSDPWCGCIHSMIQLANGRLVLAGQEIIPEWRHATVMFVSDDLGKTWQRGSVLDYGVGTHDHAGSIEGSLLERADESVLLLLRTESGFLWEATSRDGLKWEGLRQTAIPSVTCCPQLSRLADGRAALLWNAPPRHEPKNGTSRAELSLAFSDDDGTTWSKPVVVAANYGGGGRVSYPYLYERRPGEFWITTMQGGVRMKVDRANLSKGEIPVHVPPAALPPNPGGIWLFGDSTTAHRPGAVKRVTSVRLDEALQSIGSSLSVYNAGVGGNTTRDGLKRFERDVLVHRPRIVVISFGINDAAVDVWKDPPAKGSRVPAGEYRENLATLAELAGKAGAKVVFMTPNPLRWSSKTRDLYGKPPYDPERDDGFDLVLESYREAMREMAGERNLPLLDVPPVWEAALAGKPGQIDDLLLDGMHPNDRGHEITAAALLPVVRGVLR